MLTSSVTTETIKFFVKWVRDASPLVQPAVIMTDCDQVQIAALESIPTEPDPLLPVACATCNAQPFRND